ncbi:MAG: NAD(P)-dependent oxidoreductase, partial [Lachnospiraceae bacterium]|nr:NAD(P)-dependent oxidoreductase [Lachnospiraceae bacterium]
MEIVLTGSYNYVMEALIAKLSKEGNRIYALTGSKYTEEKYPKVFEQYNFPYDNSNMHAIFESINPDVVIFLGAFDDSFHWAMEEKESARYSSGLINVLIACSSLPKKSRFLYLSSNEVFTRNYDEDIVEHDEFSAEGFKAMAVRQGELTCGNYHKTQAFDAIVLRIDHLYGIPKGQPDLMEPIGHMCREAIETGKITANPNHTISLLHIQDAVEYINQFITVEKTKFHVYNLSSVNPVTEVDIAKCIAEGMGRGVTVEERAVGEPHRIVLSNQRFSEEFFAKVFQTPEKNLPRIAAHIRRNSKNYFYVDTGEESFADMMKRRIKRVVKAVIPYFETMILFVPFFMLNNRATGSQYFANLDFYLLYVLVLAVIHGQQQALFAALLATAGYLFRQQYNRSSFDVILDYNTYVWIAQLFVVGLVVGHMKDRLLNVRDEDLHELNYLTDQINDITEINSTNVQIKNIMEDQIVNQNDSFGKVYEITSSLDKYAPEEVLFYAAEVLRQLVRSDDVAIYQVANRSYARLFAATSPKARSLGNSIEYTKLTEMYEELMSDRVFINREMRDELPLMADAIFSEDEMQLIIMIWGIPWDRMNLSQANMLRIAGFLIQNAVLRANRYMDAL